MSAKSRRRLHVTPSTEFVDVETEDVVYRGERLTDARVDEIVEDARRANLVPGGKSLNGDGSHSRALSVRLPDDVRDEVDRIARDRGVSTSKLVRQVIAEFVARDDPARPRRR